ALGGIPILLHAADREGVLRPDAAVEYWDGDVRELPGGLTLLRLGGHFAGGTVLHWPAGARGQGALLSGDIVQVLGHRRSVTFMWSYPNMLPLPAREVERIAAALAPWEFDRIWGAWWGRAIFANAKAVLRESARRYVCALA
ncbi:MAG: MBL fold metallo-hydrolase, partial [Gaiellaceae bacterium]